MPLNTNRFKELLILINGPIFQYLSKILLFYIFKDEHELINKYHYLILMFNLLPIYPLDGSKLLLLIIESIYPFKKSLKLIFLISYLMILIILLKVNTIKGNIIITIIFLIIMITKEYKKINIIWNKFILERYLNNYNFKNTSIINNVKDFYKGRKHLIKKDNNYYLEKEFLEKKFKK